MRWFPATAMAVALVLLSALGTRLMDRPHPDADDDSIRIVTGIDRPTAALPTALTGRDMPANADLQPIAHPSGIVGAAPGTDAAAITALFDGQTRDPAWAPGAEAEIRSRLLTGADVRCAEFMCRIVAPMPADPVITSPDQQADAITRDWPARLSYNRLTATVVDDKGKPALVFYATKSIEFTRIVDDG